MSVTRLAKRATFFKYLSASDSRGGYDSRCWYARYGPVSGPPRSTLLSGNWETVQEEDF